MRVSLVQSPRRVGRRIDGRTFGRSWIALLPASRRESDFALQRVEFLDEFWLGVLGPPASPVAAVLTRIVGHDLPVDDLLTTLEARLPAERTRAVEQPRHVATSGDSLRRKPRSVRGSTVPPSTAAPPGHADRTREIVVRIHSREAESRDLYQPPIDIAGTDLDSIGARSLRYLKRVRNMGYPGYCSITVSGPPSAAAIAGPGPGDLVRPSTRSLWSRDIPAERSTQSVYLPSCF